MKLDFIGSMSKNRSVAIDGQECINWYTEYYAPNTFDSMNTKHQGAKSDKANLPTPGLKLFAQCKGSGAIRGEWQSSDGRMFAVCGDTLNEITQGGNVVSRGTLRTNSGQVSISENAGGTGRGGGMIIVDGVYGYMFNLSTLQFIQITDVAFPRCSHVVYIDHYFIVNELGTNKFWFSNFENGLDWSDVLTLNPAQDSLTFSTGTKIFTTTIEPVGSQLFDYSGATCTLSNGYGWMSGNIKGYDQTTGLMTVDVQTFYGNGSFSGWTVTTYGPGSTVYGTTESIPDNVVALAALHGELHTFGNSSADVFDDNGSAPGDFERVRGAAVGIGIAAPFSLASNGSQLFWLASSNEGHGLVYSVSGYQPTPISTNTVCHMIESLPRIDDAIGFCYLQDGHSFYMLTFPTANITFCYDVSTGDWHQRSYWNAASGKHERHRANAQCFCFQKNYVGDYANGNIYELSMDSFTDNGNPIRRVRTGPHVHNDRKRLFFNELEIDVERGVGTSDGTQGTEAQAFLTWSDDGGMTWSNERWLTFGKIGEYKNRLHTHRLGMSRDRVFRLTLSDPIKCVLIGARADIKMEEG